MRLFSAGWGPPLHEPYGGNVKSETGPALREKLAGGLGTGLPLGVPPCSCVPVQKSDVPRSDAEHTGVGMRRLSFRFWLWL